MHEPLHKGTHGPSASIGANAAAWLTQEAALMGGRLAQLLGSVRAGSPSVPIGQDGSDPAIEFLTARFQAAESALPAGQRAQTPFVRCQRERELPAHRLVAALHLSELELELLLLVGLPEEHEGYAAVLRGAHPRSEPLVSWGLAAQLLCADAAARVALRQALSSGPLVRCGLIELVGEGPALERSLRLADNLWAALGDLDAWPGVDAIEQPRVHGPYPGLEEWLAEPLSQQALTRLRRRARCTLVLCCDTELLAEQRACALVLAAGARPSVLHARSGANLARLSLFALMRGRIAVLRLPVTESQGNQILPQLGDTPGPVVLLSRHAAALDPESRPSLLLRIEALSLSARTQAWQKLLPELREQATILSARYQLEPGQIAELAAELREHRDLTGELPTLAAVAERVQQRGDLLSTQGVTRIRPTASWDHLVLSHDRLRQLKDSLGRLLHRGRVLDEWGFLRGRRGTRGVRLLFCGPPGTGKTLSAEVMASALGVELLVVDLARVVSKWVGETEKNLASVFETAERLQCALLFDEADALFGRRTEVSDAHDRYANLETAYLLTRLERFEGLAILATNLRQNIDPAFTRRIEFIVEFDEPDERERRSLWTCHLPAGAPLGSDVNLDELAGRYALVGSLIRNAAVAAAFLAANEGTAIHRRHFLAAIRREYQKVGRPFPGPLHDGTPSV